MNYSQITDQLYIGTTPKAEDYHLLHELGVGLVINMRIGIPPKRDPFFPPIRRIWLPVIDSPIFPIPMRFLQWGAKEALELIDRGGIVYTHCSKGRHRGPAMGACILIAQGKTPEEALQLIKQHRPVSDPYAWYIKKRIVRFARQWAMADRRE